MKRIVILVATLALSTSCLAIQLRGPVEDHRVQTHAVAERCAAQGCEAELQEDLDETAKQACLLDAIVKSKEPAVHCPAK